MAEPAHRDESVKLMNGSMAGSAEDVGPMLPLRLQNPR